MKPTRRPPRHAQARRSASPWRGGAAALALALVAATPGTGLGQIVQGRLRDAASRAPVQGSLVLLVGPGGEQLGGFLTDETGAFRLRAPAPGRYSLRAERIGYETVTSDVFELSAGPALVRDLEAPAAAVALEGIRVEGTRRCVVRPGEGLALARVWDAAQKALRNQEWTDRSGLVRFRLVHWERELDPGSHTVISESRSSAGWTGRNPIRSLPVDDLLQHGFVRKAGDGGYSFLGPDAAVLLSDAFLETHCFTLEADEGEPDLIGLGFQPLRRRSVTDISGTLWLGRRDAKLRFLTFAYTSSPWPEASGVANGRVEFDELPGGAWVIRRWWIRMPKMVQDLDLRIRGGSGLRVSAIVEVGGAATRADLGAGAALDVGDAPRTAGAPGREPGSGTLPLAAVCPEANVDDGNSAVVGVVRAAPGGQTVEGATVGLEWTSYRVAGGREVQGDLHLLTVTTDARGRYTACGVPPGVILTARASLGASRGGVRRVEVPRGGVVSVDLLVGR